MVGELLGQGRTAEIYAWGDDKVVKLYLPGNTLEDVESEFNKTRLVHAAGLPAPAAHGIIALDGRHGIVFDRIAGETLLQRFVGNASSLLSSAKIGTELQWRIHQHHIDGLPPFLPLLEQYIRTAPVSIEFRTIAMRALRKLPEGTAVCHGDFHADNVLMSPQGPVALDWSNAVRGNPHADVAWSALAFQLSRVPPGTRNTPVIEIGREAGRLAYLEGYFSLDRRARQQVERWFLPLAVVFTHDDERVDTRRAHDLIRLLVLRERVEHEIARTIRRSRLLFALRAP